jgi:hypothetical protein
MNPMGFLLDEARTSGLVTAGVSPAAGLAYLKLFRDRANVIEMFKPRDPSATLQGFYLVLCFALQNN